MRHPDGAQEVAQSEEGDEADEGPEEVKLPRAEAEQVRPQVGDRQHAHQGQVVPADEDDLAGLVVGAGDPFIGPGVTGGVFPGAGSDAPKERCARQDRDEPDLAGNGPTAHVPHIMGGRPQV